MQYDPKLRIIDGFYRDPESVRAFATTCEFRENVFFKSKSLVSMSAPLDSEHVLERIGEIISVRPDIDSMRKFAAYWGYGAAGSFQLRLGHQNKPGAVHSHTNGKWVGIIYLSNNRSGVEQVGTHLLLHKKTQLQHLDQLSASEYERVKQDKNDISEWIDVGSPTMKFNRLVIFDSRHFHAESSGFGSCIKDGRLIQIFNFTEAPAC